MMLKDRHNPFRRCSRADDSLALVGGLIKAGTEVTGMLITSAPAPGMSLAILNPIDNGRRRNDAELAPLASNVILAIL